MAAWLHASALDRVSPVLWTLLALHLVVATLFVVRRSGVRAARWQLLVACVPALATGGVAWKLAPPPAAWPTWAAAAFLAGAALAIVALATLGRSFAVLPAVRDVVSRGPYRVVRHPAYAGELVMAVACVAAAGDLVWAAWFLPLTCAVVVLRIAAEERHLRTSPVYCAYAERVPHRLLPLVW